MHHILKLGVAALQSCFWTKINYLLFIVFCIPLIFLVRSFFTFTPLRLNLILCCFSLLNRFTTRISVLWSAFHAQCEGESNWKRLQDELSNSTCLFDASNVFNAVRRFCASMPGGRGLSKWWCRLAKGRRRPRLICCSEKQYYCRAGHDIPYHYINDTVLV